MPRMKTPRGYYTISEAATRLDLSNAMVRRYVEKGRIQYMVPQGRSYGYYRKNDVDELANELNAYLNMKDDEREKLSFKAATETDMQEIVRIGRLIFDPSSTRQLTTPEWQLKALEKNHEISFTLKRDGKVLGYINTVPFTAKNPKLQKCLTVDYLSDVNILPSDIETYDTGNHVDLYIMAWATDPDLTGDERRTYGGRLIARFITKIEELGQRGVIINTIACQGYSRSGIRVLQAFGFIEVPPPPEAPHKRIFTLDIQKSPVYVAKQYREALAEWRNQHKEES